MSRTLLRAFDQTMLGSYNIGIKKEVRIATTANRALTGLAAIDGVTPVAGDRILVKVNTDPTENGIYVAAVGAWALAADADESGEVFRGEVVFVAEGTVNGGSGWINTSVVAPPIVPGTSTQTFAMFTVMNALTVGKVIMNEIPGGVINGSNVTFTLAATPETGKQALYFNGVRQEPGGGNDYTITGLTITTIFVPKSNPAQSDKLLADYISQ